MSERESLFLFIKRLVFKPRRGTNPTPSVFPRYFRARQSHCIYWDNVHFYVFPLCRQNKRVDSGLTVKRRKNDQWRHYTLRVTVRRDRALMVMLEAVTHVSEESRRDRVRGSKRYLRFKACL